MGCESHEGHVCAECWTDNCLIISKLSIQVQPKTRSQGKKKPPKRLNITKIKNVPIKQLLVEALEEHLDTIFLDEGDAEAAWITLRDTVYSTAMECLGLSTRRHRDWFDENHAKIMDLIGEKARCTLGAPPQSSAYYSKEHLQHRAAQAAWNARFLADMQNFYNSLYGEMSQY